jgi:hypothetical protein
VVVGGPKATTALEAKRRIDWVRQHHWRWSKANDTGTSFFLKALEGTTSTDALGGSDAIVESYA